jgi:predicted dehydrogenase
MQTIHIGTIGCGGIANGAHLPPLQKVEGAVIAALCDIDPQRLQATGDKYQVPAERRFLNYRELIACEAVDAVDICTPNNSHCPIAMAAVAASKPFCVEKPVGVNYGEALALMQATEAAGLDNMVCFSYRFMPAVRYARHLMDEGKIGKVLSVYAQYLKASAFMKGRRLDWRFDSQIARYGVSGDLAVHIIDMITHLVGDFTGVIAQTGIAVKERLRLDRDEIAQVDTDDYCNFLAELQGGISATFGVSRCAIGNANHINVDIYGDKGALRFDLNKRDEIQICLDDGRGLDQSMETILVPDEYKTSQMQTWVDVLRHQAPSYTPTLREGVKCQKVLDALLDSAATKRWTAI